MFANFKIHLEQSSEEYRQPAIQQRDTWDKTMPLHQLTTAYAKQAQNQWIVSQIDNKTQGGGMWQMLQ